MSLRSLQRFLNLPLFAIALCAMLASPSQAQLGGAGGGGFGGSGAGAGGGGQAPPGEQKPRFRDHIHARDGLPIRREKGDIVVAEVNVVGNKFISTNTILQQLHTRKGRFYDYETVLGDIRRLHDMGSFENPTFRHEKRADGMVVTFYVQERPVVRRVVYHGNRALNERELTGRSGIVANDPLNEFAVETGRRRLLDFYREEGFNQVAISAIIGTESEPGTVIFRINEGPLERISGITIKGNTLLSDARLKKIIKSRGPAMGVAKHIGNKAILRKIEADVKILESTYHNLGYLTATVGKNYHYDDSGKWMDLTFVIDEGRRYVVNDIQFVGNEYITEESIRARLTLKPGDSFDGTILRRDVGEIVYGYGELGFIYAEVDPQTVMLEEENRVDLVFKITEGDRWKIRNIMVNIEGEPHLMRETTLLNLIDMREGDYVDRRALEIGRRSLMRSQLLESDVKIADPPDIQLVPVE